ncbi:MAG: 23S rRNA (adenine(2503)-C(2))-methyltransferase RlmN, partial [Christensenellales bacterium]
MECLLDFNKEELAEKLAQFDLKGYRVDQVFTALNQGKSFSEMTTLNSQTKQVLSNNFTSQPITILEQKSARDGTIKFLYKLADNN